MLICHVDHASLTEQKFIHANVCKCNREAFRVVSLARGMVDAGMLQSGCQGNVHSKRLRLSGAWDSPEGSSVRSQMPFSFRHLTWNSLSH